MFDSKLSATPGAVVNTTPPLRPAHVECPEINGVEGKPTGSDVIFPDGTIKKIAAEKVQKMSNHMADVTLDFAENEKFIHGRFFWLTKNNSF